MHYDKQWRLYRSVLTAGETTVSKWLPMFYGKSTAVRGKDSKSRCFIQEDLKDGLN
jgi:hypothetical protein